MLAEAIKKSSKNVIDITNKSTSSCDGFICAMDNFKTIFFLNGYHFNFSITDTNDPIDWIFKNPDYNSDSVKDLIFDIQSSNVYNSIKMVGPLSSNEDTTAKRFHTLAGNTNSAYVMKPNLKESTKNTMRESLQYHTFKLLVECDFSKCDFKTDEVISMGDVLNTPKQFKY